MRIGYLYCPEEIIQDIHGLAVVQKEICTADKYLADRIRSNNHEVELIEYSENFVKEIKKADYDFIFNGADGIDDIEEYDQLFEKLDKLGIPFSGCNRKIHYLFTDKPKAKEFFQNCGVETPSYHLIGQNMKIPANLSYPIIIKPAATDASLGIDEDSVVYNEVELNRKLSEIFKKFDKVFIEQYIDGREFCVPIVFNKGEVETFPILEIDFSEHFENKPKILSYKAKWSRNTNAFKNTYSRVKDLEPELDNKIKETAKLIFSRLNSAGYATMDIRYADNTAYVLEINPNPYLAIESDFIKSAKHLGLTSNEFMEKIIQLNNLLTIKSKNH
ncbi:ATP-grasp domain-containing protein [Candidatus Woesearchaeota archaeon]|nr:ATP-grasp domain-containing protein [Candidatus Woesearchaeota archaeon]